MASRSRSTRPGPVRRVAGEVVEADVGVVDTEVDVGVVAEDMEVDAEEEGTEAADMVVGAMEEVVVDMAVAVMEEEVVDTVCISFVDVNFIACIHTFLSQAVADMAVAVMGVVEEDTVAVVGVVVMEAEEDIEILLHVLLIVSHLVLSEN
jgi:hypothetical protein